MCHRFVIAVGFIWLFLAASAPAETKFHPFDWCFVAKTLAPQVADDFARLGFNCVRFHQSGCRIGERLFETLDRSPAHT